MKNKKVITIILTIVLALLIVLLFFYINSFRVTENYELIKFNKTTVKVFEKASLKDFVRLDGELLNDRDIKTDKIGKQDFELLYKIKNRRYKASFTIEVVDDVAPIILGSSSFTYKIGSKIDYKKLFIIADNYDKKPSSEVQGTCDHNKLGSCKLTIIARDKSSNETRKDFTLRFIEKIVTMPRPVKTVSYSSVVDTWKTNDTMIGLDVSKWQGEIDFAKLKEVGVEFIMLRVGTQKGFGLDSRLDEYFERNIKAANKYKIPVGVYYFSYAKTNKEALEQARWVRKQIAKYKIDFPVVFDWESWKYWNGLEISLHDINSVAKTFLEEIKKHDYQVMNYSSKYYQINIWDNEYPLWLAHYTSKTDYNGKYDMWQLTDTGRVDGIKGNVDINVYFRKGKS